MEHPGFRGMFPRSKRRKTDEATEIDMASRLQLELGKHIIILLAKSRLTLLCL